jgi:serine/threonine protein kinase
LPHSREDWRRRDGVVYRAFDEVLHRDVAVKVVNKDARLDPSSSHRLLHEARASSCLAHPNICIVHDVGENEGEFYIVMELVEGKSLAAMTATGGLAPESVLRYGVQIASALARAHDRGIIHRDLKTANIVITNEGLVKVLDFGLAKRASSGIFEGPTQSFATIENASSVSGTPELPVIQEQQTVSASCAFFSLLAVDQPTLGWRQAWDKGIGPMMSDGTQPSAAPGRTPSAQRFRPLPSCEVAAPAFSE